MHYKMPISEDEFDSKQGIINKEHHAMSKAELRKTNKPIMEKKRRARINQCLGELKDLILEAMKKDPARHSKLEKADILEMTVRHLQNIQRRSLAAAAASDPAVLARFREGFTECASEATKFLSRSASLTPSARSRLRQHLTTCISALNQPQSATVMPHDFNGNIHVGGVPLIPSRLPTGELALVLPANSQLPFAPPVSDYILHADHMSAFQTVRSGHKPPSPTSSIGSSDSYKSEPATPPHKNLSSTFPTPPSHNSFTDSSPETQKPTVSSTTIVGESTKITRAENEQKLRAHQVDEYPYGQLTPPSLNSSGEYNMNNARLSSDSNASPKMALDYSMTPITGKKRAYPIQENPGLLTVGHRPHQIPNKIIKLACPTVSSSQPDERVVIGLQEGYNRNDNNERNQQPKAGGSGGSDSMWRPW